MYKKIDNVPNAKQAFLKDLFSHVKDDNINMLSSQTAFNLIVALVPFSVVAINLILFFASSQILLIQKYISLLPKDLASLANELFRFIIDQRSTGILSFGIIITIWSSSKGVKALLKSLNTAFNTENNKGFIYTQVKSVIITILLIVIIMAMLGGVVFGDFIVSGIIAFFNLTLNTFTRSLIHVLRIAVPLVLMILIFTFIFLIGPTFEKHKLPPLKPCLIGGILSTFGCATITLAYSFYINNFANMASVYGPLVGVMILFLWMNYTIMIIIFSGEVAASYLRVMYEKKENIVENDNSSSSDLNEDNLIQPPTKKDAYDKNKKDT